jgi:hypothetical protein
MRARRRAPSSAGLLQNDIVERVIRTLNDPCVQRRRFEYEYHYTLARFRVLPFHHLNSQHAERGGLFRPVPNYCQILCADVTAPARGQAATLSVNHVDAVHDTDSRRQWIAPRGAIPKELKLRSTRIRTPDRSPPFATAERPSFRSGRWLTLEVTNSSDFLAAHS